MRSERANSRKYTTARKKKKAIKRSGSDQKARRVLRGFSKGFQHQETDSDDCDRSSEVDQDARCSDNMASSSLAAEEEENYSPVSTPVRSKVSRTSH